MAKKLEPIIKKKVEKSKEFIFGDKIDDIVKKLKSYKVKIKDHYTWSITEDKFSSLKKIIPNESFNKIRNIKDNFEQHCKLKEVLSENLNLYREKVDKTEYYALSTWIVKEWGGVGGNSTNTIKKHCDNCDDMLKNEDESLKFEGIASSSKIASFINPYKYIICDARVVYSINWLLYSCNSEMYFPSLNTKNVKLNAFNIDVIVNLRNIDAFKLKEWNEIDRNFINIRSRKFIISKDEVYGTLNLLVKEIHEKLYEKLYEVQPLYYTEMLLFSIASNHIIKDIIETVKLKK